MFFFKTAFILYRERGETNNVAKYGGVYFERKYLKKVHYL